MLAVGTKDGRIRLMDAATGIMRWEVQGCEGGRACTVAMSPDGRFVASLGGGEENWKLWDVASGVVCMTGARHDGTGACICGPDHQSLKACPVVAHTRDLCAVAFSPCGKRLATGGQDFVVILWDAQTGKAELVLKGHTWDILTLTFSADGNRLASGGFDGLIHVNPNPLPLKPKPQPP